MSYELDIFDGNFKEYYDSTLGQVSTTRTIMLCSDGCITEIFEGGKWWDLYQEWLAEGNTPVAHDA